MRLLEFSIVEFSVLYIAGFGLFLAALLFGEAPACEGTPLSYLHWLITSGVWEGLWWLVEATCGGKGLKALSKIHHNCCEKSNPVLQVFYLVLLLFAFAVYERQFLSLLPLPHAAGWHRWSALASVTAVLNVFLATSISDPGTVTRATLREHGTLYQYDNVSCSRKVCETCMLLRPARSKHCPACNRCIAKFDHHCAWLNTDIGLLNMRWFLLFLLCNLLICAYGIWLGTVILSDLLDKHGVRDMSYWDPNADMWMQMGPSLHLQLEWTLAHHSMQVILLLFLAIASLMVFCFLCYHLVLIARGMTTYESMKRRLWQEIATFETEVEAADRAGTAAEDVLVPEPNNLWTWLMRKRKRREMVRIPPHLYNKGLVANFMEVLLPLQERCKAA